jgi:alkylated DNA repair dioxygenase AlkB
MSTQKSLFDVRPHSQVLVLDDRERGCWARYDARFLDLPAAAALFAQLQATRAGALPWRREAQHRYACAVGEPGVRYSYGFGPVRQEHSTERWPEWLLPVLDRVRLAAGENFDLALFNFYEDGQGALGWHSDQEVDLEAGAAIASLSLGAERDFQWRPNEGGEATTLRLEHGSLLVMGGAMQEHYVHQVPARKRVREARFNVTFRRLRAARRAGVPA